MKTILTIIFIHLVLLSSAQNKKDEYSVIEKWIRENYAGDTIIYAEKVDSTLINKAIEVIRLRKIENPRFFKNKAKTRLSKSEARYIIDELNMRKTSLWTKSLFNVSKCIPNDSIQYYAVDREKTNFEQGHIYYDTQKKTWVKTKRYLENVVFEFTEPIYIRNDKVKIILHYYYDNGAAARMELVFYKKVNNIWENWIVPFKGDW